jgi:hypothetical protein
VIVKGGWLRPRESEGPNGLGSGGLRRSGSLKGSSGRCVLHGHRKDPGLHGPKLEVPCGQ